MSITSCNTIIKNPVICFNNKIIIDSVSNYLIKNKIIKKNKSIYKIYGIDNNVKDSVVLLFYIKKERNDTLDFYNNTVATVGISKQRCRIKSINYNDYHYRKNDIY